MNKVVLDNIKELCCKKKITIAELERETKIGNGIISRWSNSSPRLDNLEKVAEFFGVSISRLLREKKES